jgi:hypothetical protein
MPSFSSGYKAEFIALFNEVEAQFKKIISQDVLADRPVKETSEKLDKLIEDFSKRIPDKYKEKKNIIAALNISKRKLYNQFKINTLQMFNKAKGELEKILSIKITTQAELLSALLKNLNKIDARYVKDVTEVSTLSFQRGTPYISDYYTRFKKATADLVAGSITEPPKNIDQAFKEAMSARSLVELSIRQEFHSQQKQEFEKDNVKLVWISTHADCSERCEPFQGKLFSLDGSNGTAEGNKYQPIEKATDIFVRTKNGRLWKNGLFGFNCRHRMIKYEPKSQPPLDYNAKEIALEREISNKQRAMERMIFKTRLEALIMGGVDPKATKDLNKNARDLINSYEKYSSDNNHAFYRERYQIPNKMRQYYRDSTK